MQVIFSDSAAPVVEIPILEAFRDGKLIYEWYNGVVYLTPDSTMAAAGVRVDYDEILAELRGQLMRKYGDLFGSFNKENCWGMRLDLPYWDPQLRAKQDP